MRTLESPLTTGRVPRSHLRQYDDSVQEGEDDAEFVAIPRAHGGSLAVHKPEDTSERAGRRYRALRQQMPHSNVKNMLAIAVHANAADVSWNSHCAQSTALRATLSREAGRRELKPL